MEIDFTLLLNFFAIPRMYLLSIEYKLRQDQIFLRKKLISLAFFVALFVAILQKYQSASLLIDFYVK